MKLLYISYSVHQINIILLWRTITVLSFHKLIVRGVDFVWWVQCLDCIFSAGWGWSDPNPVVDCILSYTLSVTILMNILHCTAAATAHTTPGNISDITDAIKYNFYISEEIDSSPNILGLILVFTSVITSLYGIHQRKIFPFYDIICLNSTFLMIIVLQPTRMRYIQCPHRAQNSFETLHCIIFQRLSHPSIIHNLDQITLLVHMLCCISYLDNT